MVDLGALMVAVRERCVELGAQDAMQEVWVAYRGAKFPVGERWRGLERLLKRVPESLGGG
jgi:hypothetical protein